MFNLNLIFCDLIYIAIVLEIDKKCFIRIKENLQLLPRLQFLINRRSYNLINNK